MRTAAPHEEMTDEENRDVLGTFTPRALAGVTVETVAAEFYATDPDTHPALFIENGKRLEAVLMDLYTRRSGSIRGKHREDLRDTIIGAPRQALGLTVPVAAGEKSENGKPPPKARGL